MHGRFDALESDDFAESEAYLASVERNLPDTTRSDYRTLEVVRLGVERERGIFRVVTTPIWRRELPDRASGP